MPHKRLKGKKLSKKLSEFPDKLLTKTDFSEVEEMVVGKKKKRK